MSYSLAKYIFMGLMVLPVIVAAVLIFASFSREVTTIRVNRIKREKIAREKEMRRRRFDESYNYDRGGRFR